MKTKFFLIFFSFIAHHSFAQDMKQSIEHQRIPSDFDHIAELLREDNTDQITYDYGKFTCHNFAKKLFLERSTLLEDMNDFDFEGIEKEWGVRINREDHTQKEPIYIVTMVHQASGFYHAINAVLIDKEQPEKVESYIFIEPQTDEILLTSGDLHKRYKRYYKNESVEVTIGIFNKFKFNGNIYQSFQDNLYKFDVYPKN